MAEPVPAARVAAGAERPVEEAATDVAVDPAPAPAREHEADLEDLDRLLPPAWDTPAPRTAHAAPARRARRPWTRVR